MSCGKDHFEPISLDRSSRFAHPPIGVPLAAPGGARARGKHGGRRPGAGAPRGNLNALKHGRNSRYQQKILATLVQIPEVAEALAKLAERRRKQQRKAEEGAAQLLAEILQRAGQIVLTPEDNQLQNNQELLAFLRSAEHRLRQMLAEQSIQRRSRRTSIKPGRGAARHARGGPAR